MPTRDDQALAQNATNADNLHIEAPHLMQRTVRFADQILDDSDNDFYALEVNFPAEITMTSTPQRTRPVNPIIRSTLPPANTTETLPEVGHEDSTGRKKGKGRRARVAPVPQNEAGLCRSSRHQAAPRK